MLFRSPLRQWIDFFELVFCSTALALSATSHADKRQRDLVKNQCMLCFGALDALIEENAGRERVYRFVRESKSWSTDGVPYMTGHAVSMICEALAALAERHLVVLDQEGAIYVRLHENFYMFVQGERDFPGAKASLDRFKVAFWPESHSANAPRRSGDSEKRESSTSSRPRDSVMDPSSPLTPQNEQQLSPVSAVVPVLLSTTQAL